MNVEHARSAALIVPPPTDQEFRAFQALIEREAGIHLAPHKKALLAGRLNRRLRELGLSSFKAYYQRVTEGGPEELTQLLDVISTNETHFFREPEHFRVLDERLVPQLIERAESGQGGKAVRVWSAGCSTGEEPYSIAMALRSRLSPDDGWSIEIIATDLSTRVIERAREGVWPIQKSNEIPYPFLKRFMLRGTGSSTGNMKVGSELRAMVEVSRFNLISDAPRWPGAFDFIFCRNVMIYFAAETKLRVVDKLLGQLAPSGHLFLGHAETLSGTGHDVEPISANIYTRRRERGERRRGAPP